MSYTDTDGNIEYHDGTNYSRVDLIEEAIDLGWRGDLRDGMGAVIEALFMLDQDIVFIEYDGERHYAEEYGYRDGWG